MKGLLHNSPFVRGLILNKAYHYGLDLYWTGAQVALRRISCEVAKVLNLHVFSVYDDGWVREWTPRSFGKLHPDSAFKSAMDGSAIFSDAHEV